MTLRRLHAWIAFVLAAMLASLCLLRARAAEIKRVPAGKNVVLEVEGDTRRVVVSAYVVLRQGMLEQLMCRTRTKEHEAILAADADARDIHKALLAAGAKSGAVVQYAPRFKPPSGSPIRISLRYNDASGKSVTCRAQEWVRDVKSRKPLACDWVFAGSIFYPNPLDNKGPPLYAANGGDVICVSNFEDAMLDLPIASTSDNSELEFEAFTEHIPPPETKVAVILEPIPAPKSK